MKERTDRLVFDEEFAEPEPVCCPQGEAWIYSRRSPLKDVANEDSAAVLIVDESRVVFIVADGCGGMACGDRASRTAVESLHGQIHESSEDATTLRTAILDGIEAANEEVRAIGGGAATTLAVVELRDHVVRPYHIGDSTILLAGNRGKVKLMTMPHAPVAYGVEAGLIEADEAIHHEDLHLVSNVVGTSDTHIEIGSEREMAPLDTLLVGSDGLFDNLHAEEIVDIIRKGPLRKAAKRLAAATSQRMANGESMAPSKPDDVTFVLYRRREDRGPTGS